MQLLVDSGPRLFPGCPQAPLPACHPKAASRDRLGQTLVLRWGQDPWAEEQPSGLWEGLRGRGAPQATVSLPVAWRSPLLPGTLPAQPWGEAPGPRAAPSPEGGPHPWGGPQPPPPAAFLPRHSPFLPLVTVGLKLGQELFQPSRSPRRARERDTGQAGDGGCGGMGGASSRVPHRLRTLRPPPSSRPTCQQRPAPGTSFQIASFLLTPDFLPLCHLLGLRLAPCASCCSSSEPPDSGCGDLPCPRPSGPRSPRTATPLGLFPSLYKGSASVRGSRAWLAQCLPRESGCGSMVTPTPRQTSSGGSFRFEGLSPCRSA